MASGGSSNVENFSPQVIRGVSKELQQMLTDAPEGIRVIMNEEDITDVQAVIDGPAGTPYSGGQFRVRCVLGKDFPSAPPKAYFVTKVFHPNVSRTGEICVNTLKKDWKPDLGLKHILLTIKCLLIVPNAESALNEEAGKMLLEQYDDYCRRAKMMTEIHAAPIKRIQDKKGKESQSTETSASASSSSSANGSSSSNASSNSTATTSSSSSSANVPVPSKKAKVKVISRDRRRTLKRL